MRDVLGRLSTVLLAVASLLCAAESFAGAPPSTTSAISFDVNPVIQNQQAIATATTVFTDSGLPIASGKLRVEQAVDALNAPTSCELQAGFVIAAEEDPTDGTVTHLADTSQLGAFGYRAHHPAEGGVSGQSQSPCLNLQVIAAVNCEGGLLITASLAAGTGVPTPGQTWTGGFVITVRNCSEEELLGVTAQGGTTGWTQLISFLADTGLAGIRKSNGPGGTKTQVILWDIGDMDPQAEANLTVSLSGLVKNNTPSGTVLFVNGPWSALPSGGIKTQYTDRMTVTVP